MCISSKTSRENNLVHVTDTVSKKKKAHSVNSCHMQSWLQLPCRPFVSIYRRHKHLLRGLTLQLFAESNFCFQSFLCVESWSIHKMKSFFSQLSDYLTITSHQQNSKKKKKKEEKAKVFHWVISILEVWQKPFSVAFCLKFKSWQS